MSTEPPSQRIQLRLQQVSQLFNSLDPSPFRERDLDPNAEDYIVQWARELPRNSEIAIFIQLPEEEAQRARQMHLEQALRNYFADRTRAASRALSELFLNGRRFLAIGIPILIICLVTSQLVRSYLGSGPLSQVLEESLLILGWVANWRPLETFLYDWSPIRARRALYRRLTTARVTIEPS
jgi:hypothetical protein